MAVKSVERMATQTDYESATGALPKIGLHTALSARFVWQGIMYSVWNCPATVLRAFAVASIEMAGKSPTTAPFQDALMLLEAPCDDLTRWYVVDTLLVAKVKLPLLHDS